MRFVPYEELTGIPNVIVDGSGNDSTVLTLSHWPGSRTVETLQADLSAEIALRYLEHPDLHVDAEAVSNNHFDEDGLMGVFALVDPASALDHRDLVVDVARAGDFGWSDTRDAARISFAISAMVDARPLTGDYAPYCARLYEDFLPLVPSLLDDVDTFRDHWREEDEFLDATNAAIDRGDVTMTEHPELDLAIVTLPSMPERPYHRFTQLRAGPVHPMAIHNRSDMSRVAYLSDHTCSVELRYESVVQFVSRAIEPRPELSLLADRLNEVETSGGKWSSDSVGYLTPTLKLRDAEVSSIAPTAFVEELCSFLATAAPAWDPWGEDGFR